VPKKSKTKGVEKPPATEKVETVSYEVEEARYMFFSWFSCSGLAWNMVGIFKCIIGGKPLYFFYNTDEEVFGVSRNNMFLKKYSTEEPTWEEFHMGGGKYVEQQLQSSKYRLVFAELRKFVHNAPATVKVLKAKT